MWVLIPHGVPSWVGEVVPQAVAVYAEAHTAMTFDLVDAHLSGVGASPWKLRHQIWSGGWINPGQEEEA